MVNFVRDISDRPTNIDGMPWIPRTPVLGFGVVLRNHLPKVKYAKNFGSGFVRS